VLPVTEVVAEDVEADAQIAVVDAGQELFRGVVVGQLLGVSETAAEGARSGQPGGSVARPAVSGMISCRESNVII
jgi:hypothetical protein